MKLFSQKIWQYFENTAFVAAFGYVFFAAVSGLGQYAWNSLVGKGFVADIKSSWVEHHFYLTVLTVVALFISVLTLWEILSLVAAIVHRERLRAWDRAKLSILAEEVLWRYKSTFLTSVLLQLIPKLFMIDVFWVVLSYAHKFSLYTTNFKWYSWIYAYFIWELSTWVWHFSAHRVRLLWCLHAPHHAPAELNMTVAWTHFFAEGYYSTVVQCVILVVFGIQPAMLLVIMSIEVTWGTFLHAGERSFKHGRLGPLQYLIITPAHHRVHHAKNPVYMDTNFCTLIPFWDWLFGTLQPLRDQVVIEYGVTRKPDPTRYVDVYFGEIRLLYRDVKNAQGWSNKIRYLLNSPGWSPEAGAEFTAATLRAHALRQHPDLGLRPVF